MGDALLNRLQLLNLHVFFIVFCSQRKKTAGWDVFQDPPPPEEDDTINPQWIDVSLKITKVIVYFITALIVLSSSIAAKGNQLWENLIL